MNKIIEERIKWLYKCLETNDELPLTLVAGKYDCSVRTAYRYAATLKDMGLPVECNHHKIYRYDRLPELMDFTPATENENEQRNNCNRANVDLLTKATREKRLVKLKNYESNTRNQACDRIVEPYDYLFHGTYLWAYDVKEMRNILFRISRIGKVEIMDRHWTEAKSHKSQSVDIFGNCAHKKTPIKLRLSMKARNLLIEEHPEAITELKSDGKTFILDTYICGYAGASRFILGLLEEIEIIAGDGLRAYINQKIMALQPI